MKDLIRNIAVILGFSTILFAVGVLWVGPMLWAAKIWFRWWLS